MISEDGLSLKAGVACPICFFSERVCVYDMNGRARERMCVLEMDRDCVYVTVLQMCVCLCVCVCVLACLCSSWDIVVVVFTAMP